MQELVIVGGGFAGTWAAMSAAATRHAHSEEKTGISVVSRLDSLCIRPRLYEGAKEEMLVPLKPLFDEIGVNLIHDSVESVRGRTLSLHSGRDLEFNSLVLAAGSAVNIPACEGAARFGFLVDDFESTRKLDDHLAKLDPANVTEGTIVVVGGSFSGIEIVTKLRKRLGEAYRLVLIDRNTRPGSAMGETLETPVMQALKEANIEFWPETSPGQLTSSCLHLSDGRKTPSQTVIFATGFRANALSEVISRDTDTSGRIVVDEMLRVADAVSVFAAGDVASAMADSTHRTLMSCQHAMPMGIAAGRNAVLDLLGLEPVAYAQPFYATCLDLGASGAVFTNGWERTIVKSGSEGAAMKAQINTQWIYPPAPSIGRQKIFEMMQCA